MEPDLIQHAHASNPKLDGLVQILNEARCLSKRVVGNRELALRILNYLEEGPKGDQDE